MANTKSNEAAIALITAGMRLRAVDPHLWSDFLRAMELQAAVAGERMLSAGGEGLVRAQGAAQMMRTHSEFLNELPQHYAKLNTAPQKAP